MRVCKSPFCSAGRAPCAALSVHVKAKRSRAKLADRFLRSVPLGRCTAENFAHLVHRPLIVASPPCPRGQETTNIMI